MASKKIQHIRRYREIAGALIRHGFGFIVEEIEIFHLFSFPKRRGRQQEVETISLGERIRLLLEELGPTFVKLGQIASTRPDLLPDHIISELEKLQDQVTSFPYEEVKNIIENELQIMMEEAFIKFEKEPLAAASIGQVHLGILETGETVAVKVQRQGIGDIIRNDLEILQGLALLAEHRFEWAARYQLNSMIDEFAKSLLLELDYVNEGKNAELIASQTTGMRKIYIPKVYWKNTSEKVLTMEYIKGTKLNHFKALKQKGYNLKIIAERFVKSMLNQIFVEGVFHADPHPGNILVLPDEVIAYLDFGMVGRLTPEMKDHLSSLIIALMRKSTDGVIKAIIRMGVVTDDVNMKELTEDVDGLRNKYYNIPLSEASLGEAVNDLFHVAFRHKIHIPTDLTLVGKALLTMEGVIEKLDPELSILDMAEPLGKKLLINRFHPKRMGKKLLGNFSDYAEMVFEFPQQLKDLTTIMKNGNLRLELKIPEVYLLLNKLDRISNRLSFSIVLLSFSIVLVGLILGSALAGHSSLLWKIPAVEIGFVIAVVMSIWLFYSIFKSGKF